MINTLSFYDFDGTLMDTPLPDSGKEVWKEKTGEEYPHVGWWGRAESLNPDVFEINPFPSVLNQLRSDTAKSDTYTVMLTSRMEKLKPQVEILLNNHDITFDDLSLKKGSDGDKDDRIKQYLQKFPDVQTINVYDDRDKEMKVFSKMKTELGDQYQINVYRVTNGNYGLVESVNQIDKIIFEEITKLYESTDSARDQLKRSKTISKEMKDKISKYVTSSSRYVSGGHLRGLKMPDELKSKSPKTEGLGFGADKDGFYLYTHRGRCKSYKTPESISLKDIEWVESTG